MTTKRKTVIVTGASQGIGAAVANLFLERGYNVVANSRQMSDKNELTRSDNLALVDGDIALDSTAAKIVDTAMKRFGSVDALVNNAGIFISKPFTDYTAEDFRALSATNLDGFFFITQRVIKQLLAQNSGGSVVRRHRVDRRSSDRGVAGVGGDDHQGTASTLLLAASHWSTRSRAFASIQ